MVELNLLATLGILLSILALAGVTALRFDQSVVPAYILVGIAVGPHAPTVAGTSLALVDDPGVVRLFGDIGVVLLLFFVGLELSLDELFANRDELLRAGVIDVGISLPLGFLLGLGFGFDWFEAAFFALIVFNSSTVIIAKLLVDLGWVADPEAKAILGVGVVEDVVTAFGFAALAVLLVDGGDVSSLPFSLVRSVLFLLALVAFAHYGASVLERLFDDRPSELFLLGVLGLATFVAGVGLAVGVSEAVAAFVAGTAFGRTHHVDRIRRLVASSRDLFAATFFLGIGLATDPALLFDTFAVVTVATVVTTAGQLSSGFLAGRAYGLDRRRAIRVGCALTPRGEFSLVVAAFLTTAGTTPALSEAIPAFTVGYVLMTSVLGTVLMRRADLFARMVTRFSPAG
ncbi:cation:proton antiporter [Halogeometricum limi]|uniref:Monovalent cation:H+ antiporter-2, CPA2 family n=1 Tax=Halogeometricum limi TaxID=555875 RepID=A0A1I6FQK5_9EURY|nr:cation:proton antiporter [Halogeometricum limi]SFR32232.1 monovalent cation:H+ antiporter-2, CPA2 family [Halogeometricum limi]